MDKEIKIELKDLIFLFGMNLFGFGLWYFAKYHLNFDVIQLFPITFILAMGILAIGGVIWSISFRAFELYKTRIEDDQNS